MGKKRKKKKLKNNLKHTPLLFPVTLIKPAGLNVGDKLYAGIDASKYQAPAGWTEENGVYSKIVTASDSHITTFTPKNGG